MTSDAPSNNERLRQIVKDTGLAPAVALTIFNRGLGTACCTESRWKRFLAVTTIGEEQHISDEWLAHAIQQFSKLNA